MAIVSLLSSKRSLVFSAVVAGALLVQGAMAETPALGPGPAVKLKWVGGDTPQQRQHKVMLEWGNTIIPERSNGRVTFEMLTVSELAVTGAQIGRLLERGTIDVSKIGAQQLSGEFPIIEMADLALQSPDLDSARSVGEKAMPTINEELESKGIRLLAMWPFGAQVFYCKGDVAGISDINGKKVRGAGATIQKWLRSVGAEPLDIGFAEVYTALERNVTDCAITGIISGYTQKWWEVTDSLFVLPVQWGVNFTGVNLESWNELPEDVQEFLAANFAEMGRDLWARQGKLDQDGVICNTGAGECPYGPRGNMKRVDPTDEDLARTRDGLKEISLADWLTRCKGCGSKYNAAIAPISGVTAP